MKRLLEPNSGASSASAQKAEDRQSSQDMRAARLQQARKIWKTWKEWNFIHLRRTAHLLHGALASRRAVGPASFLTACAALGVALTLTTL